MYQKRLLENMCKEYWKFVENTMIKYQQRENWASKNCIYRNSGEVVPDSLRQYTTDFFNGLAKCIKEMK